MVVHILSDTADSVSAHLGTASIHVVHFHLEVCHITWINENYTVPADSKMTVTQKLYNLTFAFCRDDLPCAIHIDIIIAAAMHFCEFHCINLPS